MSNMPQGISVFDEHLRLRVWNAGFLEVLNLPASAVYDGVHFSDLIRIPATRGEYGPGKVEDHVSRITALALEFKAHHVVRTQPTAEPTSFKASPCLLTGSYPASSPLTRTLPSKRKPKMLCAPSTICCKP